MKGEIASMETRLETANEEKKQALEKHKQGMSESELELFKEEEWAAKYN